MAGAAPSAPAASEGREDAPAQGATKQGAWRQVVRTISQARSRVVIEDDEATSSEEWDGREGEEAEDVAEVPQLDSSAVADCQYALRKRHNEKRGTLARAAHAPQPLNLRDFLGAQADPVDMLPTRQGWLEKARPGWFNAWQRRWFVLCRRQLQWYNDPSEASPLGTLDFDLVDCEVERLWGVSQQEMASSGAKARGYCSSCDPLAMVDMSMSRVCFRVCPVGGDRAFELRVADAQEGEAWVEALAQHIGFTGKQSDCTEACASKPPASLDTFGRRRWWKVRRISPSKFQRVAQTGDILLFRSTGGAPKVIRTASGGRFDHVALVLKLADDEIGLFEATGNLGVGLCTWQEFLENEWQALYPELALRRVRFPRTAERLSALEAWCSEVNGRPYGLTLSKLRQRASVSAGGAETDGSFFCSELVAEALKVIGVLPRGVSSTQFWPSSFEASHRLPIEPTPGCGLGEELTVDFSLEEDQTLARGAEGKQRDATTNW